MCAAQRYEGGGERWGIGRSGTSARPSRGVRKCLSCVVPPTHLRASSSHAIRRLPPATRQAACSARMCYKQMRTNTPWYCMQGRPTGVGLHSPLLHLPLRTGTDDSQALRRALRCSISLLAVSSSANARRTSGEIAARGLDATLAAMAMSGEYPGTWQLHLHIMHASR